MSAEHSVTQWIQQLKAGEQTVAAERLWHRYFAQLVALARRQLATAAGGIADGEDVAICVFSSLCLGARNGKYPKLLDRENLWSLLVAMTVLKSRELIRRERRKKRGGGMIADNFADGPTGSVKDYMDAIMSREPSPDFALAMAEQCGRLLDTLDPQQRQIATMKLQGATNAEIASELGCGIRTIERRLAIIRMIWEQTDAVHLPAR